MKYSFRERLLIAFQVPRVLSLTRNEVGSILSGSRVGTNRDGNIRDRRGIRLVSPQPPRGFPRLPDYPGAWNRLNERHLSFETIV